MCGEMVKIAPRARERERRRKREAESVKRGEREILSTPSTVNIVTVQVLVS
jgi:hypothetical protein